jgi:hypothetical protein
MKISLSIVHAPWIPERAASMARLREDLGVTEYAEIDRSGWTPAGPYYEETARAPKAWWVWHELQMRWSAASGADWCFFLQDDAIIPPAATFWPALVAMCEGSSAKVICMHNGHPAARGLFVNGERSYTTNDGLVGQFYGMKRELVDDFLGWRVDELVDGEKPGMQRLTEDTLLALFCQDRGLRMWHPIPTLYDHDLRIGSTNDGFDAHLYRAPQVCWHDARRVDFVIEGRDPNWWAKPSVHLGNFYETPPSAFAPLVLRNRKRADELVLRYHGAKCPEPYRRFFHRVTA